MHKYIFTEDFDLANNVYLIIVDKVNAQGEGSLSTEEKTVYFIWTALGLLGNGSFQYFFENGIDAEASAQAFQELGLLVAADCFR